MVSRILPVFLVGLVLTTVPAHGQEGETAPGTRLYQRRCASCHQLSGAAVEAIERTMGVTMRHLGSAEVQAKSTEALSSDIVDGTGKMRAIRNVSEEEVADLVSFMRNLTEP